MIFGDYIKNLRNEKALSQRELAEKAGLSNSEISRLESGERKKPSPVTLRAIAPILGVTYEDLINEAGYAKEVVDHPGYIENIYRDEDGRLVEIVTAAKDIDSSEIKWANVAFRVSSSDISKEELDIISAQTEALLQQFLKNNKK